MKVFISQPMNGLSNDEIINKRSNVILKLSQLIPNESIEIIDSILTDTHETSTPLYCLGKSIQSLSEADLVVFLDGWYSSRGCRIEHECATQYHIDTLCEWYIDYLIEHHLNYEFVGSSL